jgi:RNA polymerase sigma-70 factor, ECF subfamily
MDPVVVRAQGGDAAAFSELWRRHHPQVFGLCSRMLPRSDVEDAVQQTFLEAWRSLPKFEGKSRFSTWLCRIAINTCFSLRRRVRRWWLAGDDDVAAHIAEHVAVEGPDAAEVTATHQANAALSRLLPQLTERKRLVLVLVDLEGYTSPEVADLLSIPEATVRTRLFYARKELLALLRNEPSFQPRIAAFEAGASR